jgi:hypothetical protein
MIAGRRLTPDKAAARSLRYLRPLRRLLSGQRAREYAARSPQSLELWCVPQSLPRDAGYPGTSLANIDVDDDRERQMIYCDRICGGMNLVDLIDRMVSGLFD